MCVAELDTAFKDCILFIVMKLLSGHIQQKKTLQASSHASV